LAATTFFLRSTLNGDTPNLLVIREATGVLEAIAKALQHIIDVHQALITRV
jgi:hypothetical protein